MFKRNKPGPKKGTRNVSPDLWCGIIKEDGTPCRSQKKTGLNTCFWHAGVDRDVEALIPGQKYDLPPEMPLTNIGELALVLADTVNRVRTGKLKTTVGNSVAIASRELARIFIAQEKLSPEKAGMRAFSREAAAKLARGMSVEQAMKLIRERDSQFLLEQQSDIRVVDNMVVLPDLPKLRDPNSKEFNAAMAEIEDTKADSALIQAIKEDEDD